uniref:Uncharacterized protein n=1 Tax=Lates calcarifer TaxID=8187 RepID=A0A4W6G7W0_LATCA
CLYSFSSVLAKYSCNFCWGCFLMALCYVQKTLQYRLCSWLRSTYLARGRLRWPGQAWLLPAASWFPSGCGKCQQGTSLTSAE